MATCDVCGEQEPMPYQCRLCGGTFCSAHRLPENHGCPGLENWDDPGGVFDSGFDDSVQDRGGRSTTEKVTDALGVGGRTGLSGYVRRNVTFLVLGVMWLTFAIQYVIAPFVFGINPPAPGRSGDPLWYNLFTVNTAHPEYVWTWFTSIFSHGGLTHILLNSIVLYFFGPVVERRIGSKTFAGLFLASGAIAGLAQVGATLVADPSVLGQSLAFGRGASVLGASGAIAAVLGVLTVLNPNLRIYLYFIIPMPLWVATALFAGFAVLSSTVGGVGAGGIAQVAHLAGLVLGVAYGFRLKRRGERAPEQLRFGGGPGGPGRGGRRRF